MRIMCGNCGKVIVVPNDLVPGQHVRCPYCNEKSAFDKPSRVELPTAVRPILERPTPERPVENKPKLAIRRPVQAPQDRSHMNAAAAAVDARVRKAERKRRMARMKKTLGNWISMLALVALLWAGYVVWKAMHKDPMPAYVPEQMTQLISNTVEKVNAAW